jgi:predicted RNase H-like HicB family nuclease
VTKTSDEPVSGPQVFEEALKTMIQAYKVVIEHNNQDGYVATFPELAGCQAQAGSLKALMNQIREALAHHPEVGEPTAAPCPAVPGKMPGTG